MSESTHDDATSLDKLASEAWRERKEATDSLVRRLQHEYAAGDEAVIQASFREVLGVVVAPPTPSARAAASDVLTRMGAASVPFLIAAIEEFPELRRALVEVLGTVATESELPRFVELFEESGDDENLRCVLVTAVAKQRGEQSLALLTTMLEDPSEVVKLHVLDGFLLQDRPPSTAVLEGLLERPTLRRMVINLLGESAEAAALPLVWRQLSNGLPGVRSIAARSAEQLLNRRFDSEDERLAYAETLVADEATVEGLISLLEHSDVQAVSASAKLLALVGGEASFSSLLNVLHVGEVASAATMMLRRLGTEGKALLAAALQRGRAGPCYAQCLALVGELTVDEIEDDLVSMLSVEVASEDEEIMAAALRSLGRTGGLGQLPALLGACERDDGLGDAAADAVAEVLARAGKREIPVELLPEQRWPSSGSLARNLCRVAGKLSNEASVASLVFLLASSDIDVRVAAAHALGEIQGQHEGVGALAFALADEEAHVRAAACRSLGALGSIDSLNSLLAASSDASSLVRAAAVQALVQLDNPVAASRMREIILEDSSPTVVVHAIEGLKVVHDEQTLGLVMSLCTSADSEVAKAAARVLRGFPSHRATAALIGLLAHERWDVRWVAAESLGTRGDPTAIGAITQVLLKEGDALVARTLQETLDRLEDLGAPSKTERGARHE